MNKNLTILIGISIFLIEILLKVNPVYGFLSYAILITACLLAISRLDHRDKYEKLTVVLLILPMLRIAELFINFDYTWRSCIIYYLLAFLVMVYIFKFDLHPGYTKKNLIFLPLAIITGVVLGLLGNNFNNGYPELLPFLLIIVFSEELLFRGMLQNLVKEVYGSAVSVIAVPLLYTVFSLNYTLPALGIIFLASFASSLFYHYTKNIFVSFALSLSFNFFMFIYPVISL
jgi:membrane protease YdiL (CAAX protease family)